MNSQKITLRRKAKKIVNNLLSPLQLEIVKRPGKVKRTTISIPVGKFNLLVQSDNNLWREYAKNPEYTGELRRLAELVFRSYPNAMMIDVGANIGDTAAIVKTVADVPILCIEGDQEIFALLEKNIVPMTDVTACQCFLGEKTEMAEFTTEKEGWDTTLVPATSGNETGKRRIKLISLDDCLQRAGPRNACKLLKVDVEGFDSRVIRGATSLLQTDTPVLLFELNHENLTKLGEDGLKIFPFLDAHGYKDLLVFDAQGHFILPCETYSSALLLDLYEYAMSVKDLLFYYDICAFHKNDTGLAEKFLSGERAHRRPSRHHH
jgi:FkbM family methyltransferase